MIIWNGWKNVPTSPLQIFITIFGSNYWNTEVCFLIELLANKVRIPLHKNGLVCIKTKRTNFHDGW